MNAKRQKIVSRMLGSVGLSRSGVNSAIIPSPTNFGKRGNLTFVWGVPCKPTALH